MGYIKASTSTQFPVGSKVKITDKGQACTTYRDMVTYLKLYQHSGTYTHGHNPFKEGQIGVVVGKAMHEHEVCGEILAVRVDDRIGLILANRGVVEFEEPVVIGKPKLPHYEHAPLTPHATERLSKYFDKAPAWATHVGSDTCGIHFFDHHPHVYSSSAQRHDTFLKGLLPQTHKSRNHISSDSTEALEVVVIVRKAPEPTTEEQLEALKVELAATKAKLWEAEQKLKKIAELAE